MKLFFIIFLIFVPFFASADLLDSLVRTGGTANSFGFLYGNGLSAISDTTKQSDSFGAGFLRAAPWSRPLYADLTAPFIKGEIFIANNSDEYNWGNEKGKYRPYCIGTFGVNVPIWSGRLNGDKIGLSITTPMSANLWLDLFEPNTSAVINTDYRFKIAQVNLIYRPEKSFWGIKNYVLSLTPFGHESTHIGDELSIRRIKDEIPITRVDVSHNFYEISVTVNDAEFSTVNNHCFRAGVILLVDFRSGWYSMGENEGDHKDFTVDNSPYEFYFQYQYQTVLKSCFQGVASVEVRNRLKYGYAQYEKSSDYWQVVGNPTPSRVWCFNGFVGLRYKNIKIPIARALTFGLHLYHGNNPYGQFRSMKKFSQAGFSLIFE